MSGTKDTLTKIKNYLLEVNLTRVDSEWSEGFLIGLHYTKHISDEELDSLMNWLKCLSRN
jgi:hypothetical protein